MNTIHQLRKDQTKLIKLFDAGTDNLAIKAPAGSGKTQAAIKQLCRPGQTVGIYTPTLDLAVQIQKDIFTYNSNLITKIRYGRNQVVGGIPMCQRADETEAVFEEGRSIQNTLCNSCEYFQTCPYIASVRQKADVTVYTHPFLGLSRSNLAGDPEDVVIIDETFWEKMIKTITITRDNIAECDYIDPTLRDAMLEYLDSSNPVMDKLRGSTFVNTMRPYRDKIISTLTRVRSYTDMRHFFDKLYQAVVSTTPHNMFLVNARQEIVVGWKKNLVAGGVPTRADPLGQHNGSKILIIDADADENIIKLFVPNIKFVELTAPRIATITQVSTRMLSKESLRANSSNATLAENAQKTIDSIQRFVDDICEKGKTVVFTYDFLVPSITMPKGHEICHFGALRGSNRWKHFDNVIIIGRNQPRIADVEQLARGLYCLDPEPIKVCQGKPEPQWLEYKMSGDTENIKVKVPVHPDARVQALIVQILAESVQGIDRIRPMDAIVPKNAYILSKMVLDNLEVDVLKSWSELRKKSILEKIFNRSGGLVLGAAYLLEEFPDLFKNINAANYWQNTTLESDDSKRFLKEHGLEDRLGIEIMARSHGSKVLTPPGVTIEDIEKKLKDNKRFRISYKK